MSDSERTTIAIDRDVLQAARERAEATGQTLGQTVSNMLRENLTAPGPTPAFRNGIKLLPPRRFVRKVTVEDINALLDESE